MAGCEVILFHWKLADLKHLIGEQITRVISNAAKTLPYDNSSLPAFS